MTGVANLQKFIEEGGLFVTVGGVSNIPIDYGITTGVSVQAADKLQARGSIYNSTFADRKSPIAYGYDEGSRFTSARLRCFRLLLRRTGGGFGGGGGGGAGGAGGAGGGSQAPIALPDVVAWGTLTSFRRCRNHDHLILLTERWQIKQQRTSGRICSLCQLTFVPA